MYLAVNVQAVELSLKGQAKLALANDGVFTPDLFAGFLAIRLGEESVSVRFSEL